MTTVVVASRVLAIHPIPSLLLTSMPLTVKVDLSGWPSSNERTYSQRRTSSLAMNVQKFKSFEFKLMTPGKQNAVVEADYYILA